MSKDRVRIGCDPEIFLIDYREKIVPITGLVGGTKHATAPLISLLSSKLKEGDAAHYKKLFKSTEFGVLEDGACLEFNTPSFNDWDRFCGTISNVMSFIEQWAASKGLRVAYNTPEATFDEALFEKNAALKDIGCSPDFDAYSNAHSRKPVTHETLGNKRYSGGHIHLGYNVDLVPPFIMAKLLDLVFGLPLIILGEKQKGRRVFYGQAGTYRPKPYGVEYRTPSNIWLQHTTNNQMMYLVSSILELGRSADKRLPLLKAVCAPGAVPWAEVRRAFLTEDRNLAIDLFGYLCKQFPDLLNVSASAFRTGFDPVWDSSYKPLEATNTAKKKKSEFDLYNELNGGLVNRRMR